MASDCPFIQEEGIATRIGSQESQSALESSPAERIPVEIWHRILCIAIACSLLPRTDDNYFQRRDVAAAGCAKLREYVLSERIRTKLQLVCQSWYIFLEEHSDRLVYLSAEVPLGHWPPIKKWERVVRIVGPNHLFCACWSGRCHLTPRFKEKMRMVGGGPLSAYGETPEERLKDHLRLVGPRCGAILWPSHRRSELMEPIPVGRFGSVTILCDDLSVSRDVIPNSFQSLVYLSIHVPPRFTPSFHLDLPHLTALMLCFLRDPKNASETTHLTNSNSVDIAPGSCLWDTPRLRCITFFGTFREQTVFPLLHLFARCITECHILPISFGFGHHIATKNPWPYLPAVRVLGVTFEQLVSLPPPNGHEAPIDVLVHWGGIYKKYIPPRESADRLMEAFQRNWGTLTIRQLTIGVSWAGLVQSVVETGLGWRNIEVEDTDLRMFDVLSGLGKGLRDRDGVLFDESIRRQLHETLRIRRE